MREPTSSRSAGSRVVKAIRERGVRQTAESALARLEDRLVDRRHGVATVGVRELDGFEIVGPNRKLAVSYQPARFGHVRRVFAQLPIDPSEWTLVDIGAGKGRVLVAASAAGFRRTVGVEFALELCEAAEANREAFERRHGRPSGIEVVHADAATVSFKPEPTVFYAFNPFDRSVMSQVVDNIAEARADRSWDAWFCYTNPQWLELIDEMPGAVRFGGVDRGGGQTLIWHLT